ncbi:MAG: anti-sigma factor family protein [Steroidobacteraceae bacterium]
MSFPDEVLMAYADDELDARTRAAVEAAMVSDPEIARRVARHKALRSRFRSAFDKVLDEPVPTRLLKVMHGAPADSRENNIVPMRGRQARRARHWSWPQWTAVAASLIVGVIAGRLALVRFPGPIVMRDGQVLASGALADALSNQLAADQSTANPVRIGVSFRSKSGQYCRTFDLASPGALAGLACRAAGEWRVRVLARTESDAGGSGSYRQAASSMPPAVIAAVGDLMAGEPLDAQAEAAARGRHWQP